MEYCRLVFKEIELFAREKPEVDYLEFLFSFEHGWALETEAQAGRNLTNEHQPTNSAAPVISCPKSKKSHDMKSSVLFVYCLSVVEFLPTEDPYHASFSVRSKNCTQLEEIIRSGKPDQSVEGEELRPDNGFMCQMPP